MIERVSKYIRVVIIAWICLVCGINVRAVYRSPLLITVTVEGLSDEYLEVLSPYFGKEGLRKIMDSSLYYHTVDYGPGVDAVAAEAILHTGAAPTVNGISAATVYDADSGRARHSLYDDSQIGNFTDLTLSPAAILSSTIADELKINTSGEAYVISLAPSAHGAIIASGHAGNSAFWIDDITGAWASTAYYRDVPRTVTDYNYRTPLNGKLDTLRWTPVIAPELFPSFARTSLKGGFSHTFPRKAADRIERFKTTPMVNTEIVNMAIQLLKTTRLGRDESPDMLNLTLRLDTSGRTEMERADAYLRLDRDLSRLMSEAQLITGADNVTLVVTGVPGKLTAQRDYRAWNVPAGDFSVRKAVSLLNLYLIAVHGNGDWVKGYHRRHFYLNRQLIKERNLDLNQFRSEVADFLARMSGVSSVYTIDSVIAGRIGDNPQALRRNTSVAHSGDVIIEVSPGWVITDENLADTELSPYAAESYPFFISGPGIGARRVTSPVDARAIAPMISRAMHINAPNGATIPSPSLK
ncbi:MAG: alkaline phosphatase family protein [Paramuribaculum sp.]|nr:alkaline phosphatase family protein [Paramuribaculum sp.]